MKTATANKQLESIIAKVEKDGVLASGLIDDLKGLREIALKEEDPLVVKVLRLTYEFIEDRQGFDVQGQFDEDEEVNELGKAGSLSEDLRRHYLQMVVEEHLKTVREAKSYEWATKMARANIAAEFPREFYDVIVFRRWLRNLLFEIASVGWRDPKDFVSWEALANCVFLSKKWKVEHLIK